MSHNQSASQDAWMHDCQQRMLQGGAVATAGPSTDGVPENAITGPGVAHTHLCSQCGKTYKSKGNLARHQKTHDAPLSFPCPISDCNRNLNGFNRKDHVVEHLRAVHHIDKEAAKWIMDSRGAVNPLPQGNLFNDLLAAGSVSTSGDGNGMQGQQGQ